jgi:ribosomal protein S27E
MARASVLDGNAIGGLLAEVFGTDMTAVTGVCAACGRSGPLAETVVYLAAPGTVVRCRECASILLVIVSRSGVNCVDAQGLAALGG